MVHRPKENGVEEIPAQMVTRLFQWPVCLLMTSLMKAFREEICG